MNNLEAEAFIIERVYLGIALPSLTKWERKVHIGTLLIEQKEMEMVPRGEWMSFLLLLPFSPSTARAYMRLASAPARKKGRLPKWARELNELLAIRRIPHQ
jgi:hypothetical protein